MTRFQCFLVTVIMLVLTSGCATAPRHKFLPYSEGLPSGLQWKCNPGFSDINGDGLLDVAAVPRKGDGARVWINGGGGSWTPASNGLLDQNSCGGGVDFGDINHDGLVDLAVGDHCQGIFVYTGDGQGNWTLASEGLPKFQADDIALADFNGDGHLDLLGCSSADQGIRMFLGDGAGRWRHEASTGLPTEDDCHEIALGDYNEDGVIDMAATMIERPMVWISDGRGRWTASIDGIPRPRTGGEYWGVSAGDVNQDGHLDLAFGRTLGGPEIFLGDGKGSWRGAHDGLSAVVGSAWGVGLGDIDRDGHPDLLVSGKRSLQELGDVYGLFFFRGDGQGGWQIAEKSGLPVGAEPQSWGVSLADLEGDGPLEVGCCFGSGGMNLPPFIPNREEILSLLKGATSGPRGSVRVWKLK